MDEIKKISSIEFDDLASKRPFPQEMLAKDYFLTVLLYLLKDVEGNLGDTSKEFEMFAVGVPNKLGLS